MNTCFVILIVSLATLIFSERLAVKYLSHAAPSFNVSEFTIAFILLAVATSMPELFVFISSAVSGASDIITSITLGSNIINTIPVIGLAAFLSA